MGVRTWKQEVHKRDNHTCQECGAKEDPKHPTFQCHHIVFKCRGGSTTLDNLVLLCPSCHRRLHKMNPVKPSTTKKQKRSKKHRRKGKKGRRRRNRR